MPTCNWGDKIIGKTKQDDHLIKTKKLIMERWN